MELTEQEIIEKLWAAYHEARLLKDKAEAAYLQAQTAYYKALNARDARRWAIRMRGEG